MEWLAGNFSKIESHFIIFKSTLTSLSHTEKLTLPNIHEHLCTPPMALSPALLHSAGSTFYGQLPPTSVRLTSATRCPCSGGLLVTAMSSVVLVEKSEAEKVNRLKTTYLEKIVPLLKEEFKYTNVHQVYSTLLRLLFLAIKF